MRVRDAMIRTPVHVSPDSPVRNARLIAQMHHVPHLPVCDGDRVVAVLRPEDYAEDHADDDASVGDLTVPVAPVVECTASIQEARGALETAQADAAAVVDDGVLVGVLPWARLSE